MSARLVFWVSFLAFAAWCALADEGKIFTLKVASAVGFAPPVIELDFEQLKGGLQKEAALGLHPALDYHCYDDDKLALFGKHSCNDTISAFNGMRAYSIAWYFKRDGLHVVRVALQPESYPQAVQWLDAQYPRTDIKTEGSFTGGKKYPVTVWKTPSGNYVMASQDQTMTGETIVLWADSFAGVRP